VEDRGVGPWRLYLGFEAGFQAQGSRAALYQRLGSSGQRRGVEELEVCAGCLGSRASVLRRRRMRSLEHACARRALPAPVGTGMLFGGVWAAERLPLHGDPPCSGVNRQERSPLCGLTPSLSLSWRVLGLPGPSSFDPSRSLCWSVPDLLSPCELLLACVGPVQGKVHGSLARAGKVRGQTPKVAKQDKKKRPEGRAYKRLQYNRRFVTAGEPRPLALLLLRIPGPHPCGLTATTREGACHPPV